MLTPGEGCWVTDVDGRRYLDALAGYPALNFGHGHPHLLSVAREQLDRLTLASRAFETDRLAGFASALARLCGKEMVLPMNTGAEAVESGIKVARRWGAMRKGVSADRSDIVVMDGNFHGRTTTIVGFSTDEVAREGFGPFTPGFTIVPYGDLAALDAAVDPALMTGKQVALAMAKEGVLVKETHGSTIRIAPPLTVGVDEVRIITDTLKKVLSATA